MGGRGGPLGCNVMFIYPLLHKMNQAALCVVLPANHTIDSPSVPAHLRFSFASHPSNHSLLGVRQPRPSCMHAARPSDAHPRRRRSKPTRQAARNQGQQQQQGQAGLLP